MTTATPQLREAVRAIVLDAQDRILLLRYDENGGFWATPGGQLEQGEDHAAATLRELREELGIDQTAVELGAQLAQRSKDHLVGGREVRQTEAVYPHGLADLIVHVLERGTPQRPIELAG